MLPYQPSRSGALMNLGSLQKATDQRVHVAFIDPLPSAKYLGQQLRQEGIETSAVYTVVDSPDDFLQPDIFDHYFYINNHQDLSKVATHLQKSNVNFVYYGSDHSIQVADILANILAPDYANDLADSSLRSDPFMLQHMLAKNNVATLKQIKIDKLPFEEIEAELANFRFPVVNKPINHFGSLGMKVCHSIDDVKYFMEQDPTIFSHLSDYNVIQEFLAGTQFFVDSFSMNGTHHISGIQRVRRKLLNHKPIILYTDIIALETEEARTCISYAKKVMDIAGLKNGFGHTEILLSALGPMLLTMSPRLSAANGFNDKLFKRCGFVSQTEYLVCALKQQMMPMHDHLYSGRKVYLHNYEERVIKPLNLALLLTLPSYQEAIMLKRAGSCVGEPQTPGDCVGHVLLVNRDPRQLEMDYSQIIEWEMNQDLF